MDKLFQIGSFYFQVITRENLLIPENFLLLLKFSVFLVFSTLL